MAATKCSGAFWNSIRPTVPTTGTSGSSPSSARARARVSAVRTTGLTATAGAIRCSASGRASPRRSASVATPVPMANTSSVIRARRRSIPTYAACRSGSWKSWNGKPWYVCATSGTPARWAASRPSAPALALCVWTTSKPRARNSVVSRLSAVASLRGAIGATRDGSTTVSMPAASAWSRSALRAPVTTVTW